MDKKKSIEVLQFLTTHLSQGAFAHKVQGKLFASMGFSKLGEKYADHYAEEMGWVDMFIDRIYDLNGEVRVEANQAVDVCDNPVQYVELDCKVSIEGIALLRQLMGEVKDDVTTYDILKDYLKDEEEDQAWSEEQLGLIKCIGEQNWLVKQM